MIGEDKERLINKLNRDVLKLSEGDSLYEAVENAIIEFEESKKEEGKSLQDLIKEREYLDREIERMKKYERRHGILVVGRKEGYDNYGYKTKTYSLSILDSKYSKGFGFQIASSWNKEGIMNDLTELINDATLMKAELTANWFEEDEE